MEDDLLPEGDRGLLSFEGLRVLSDGISSIEVSLVDLLHQVVLLNSHNIVHRLPRIHGRRLEHEGHNRRPTFVLGQLDRRQGQRLFPWVPQLLIPAAEALYPWVGLLVGLGCQSLGVHLLFRTQKGRARLVEVAVVVDSFLAAMLAGSHHHQRRGAELLCGVNDGQKVVVHLGDLADHFTGRGRLGLQVLDVWVFYKTSKLHFAFLVLSICCILFGHNSLDWLLCVQFCVE